MSGNKTVCILLPANDWKSKDAVRKWFKDLRDKIIMYLNIKFLRVEYLVSKLRHGERNPHL